MLRFGIVGTNFISENFIDAVNALPDVRVTSVASRKEETARAFAEKHGIPSFFGNYDEFLTDAPIDAVYIATPIGCHHGQTVAALRKGKHVFAEKAAAPRSSLLSEMIEEADARGLVFMEAMRPIHTPTFEFLSRHLSDLGAIRYVQMDFCQYSSRYDAFKAGDVKNAFNPALSNAAVLDIGIYPLSCLLFLFGEPTGVHSSSLLFENGFEGRGTAILSYPTMTAVANYSKIEDSAGPSVIVGEKGVFAINKLTSPRTVTFTPRGGEARTVFTDPTENNMCYEIRHFADAVNGCFDHRPFLKVSEGALRLTDAIRKENGVRLPCDE